MTYCSSPKENAGVSSLRAVVVDVFVQEGVNKDTVAVVEDNGIL